MLITACMTHIETSCWVIKACPQLTVNVSASGSERGEYEKVINFSLKDEQGGMGDAANCSTSSENT